MAKISAHGGATNELAETIDVDISETQVEPDQVDDETEVDEQVVDQDETDGEQVEQGPESGPEVDDEQLVDQNETDSEVVEMPSTGDPKAAWIEWARYRGEPDPDVLTKAELVQKYGPSSG
jgi:hypothetical protein